MEGLKESIENKEEEKNKQNQNPEENKPKESTEKNEQNQNPEENKQKENKEKNEQNQNQEENKQKENKEKNEQNQNQEENKPKESTKKTEKKQSNKKEQKEQKQEKSSQKEKQTKKQAQKENANKKGKNNTKSKSKEKESKKENSTKFRKVEQNKKEAKNAVEKMMEYRKKRILTPIITIIIIIIIAIFCSTIFAVVNINNESIINGITIEGIDVGGLTKEEAIEKMNNIYKEKKEKDIEIAYQDYTNTISPTILEVNYSVEKAVEEAYETAKSDNIIQNNYEILYRLFKQKDINIEMTLNEEIAKQTIKDIGINLPGIVIESSHAIEENELIITKGKTGIVIDEEKMLEKVKEKLQDINTKENAIEIPVKEKAPEQINIEQIHEEIYKEPQDAYIVKEPFAIYPEVNGIDFDIEKAKEILQEEKEEYIIPLTITQPKIKLSQIGTEAFPNQLSTYTTRYDPSDVGRSTNLSVACKKLNGTVILPGETFSYNQTLGPRTVSAGYKTGKAYSGGEVVDSIGGGICQISSTLYNSVLMANLEIVERKNHQFTTAYVPAGRDATVAYGVIDFKFKNTRKYPIRLVASAQNGIATVSIYGIKEEKEYTFTFSTKTIASIPFTTKYEEDASLPAGTENVKQKGVNGIKTETYITKMLNGAAVSTTLLSRDTYDAMTQVIVKGKGKANNTTETDKKTNTINTNTTNTNTTTNKTNTTTNKQTNSTKENTTNKNNDKTTNEKTTNTTNNKTENKQNNTTD